MSVKQLWQAYREAFGQFADAAHTLAEVKGKSLHDPAEAEQALLRVEHARLVYNDIRDVLAASLMPAESRRSFLTLRAAPLREEARVKSIAEMLWELGGKAQGSADVDWYRAERVVRYAGSEVACAR